MTVIKWIKEKQRVRRVKKSSRKVVKAIGKRVTAQGKRAAVQYNIQYTRKFDGKKYHLLEFTTNKQRAERMARDERVNGFAARVIPVKAGYAAYIRKKKK